MISVFLTPNVVRVSLKFASLKTLWPSHDSVSRGFAHRGKVSLAILCSILLTFSGAWAQSLDPRSYSNAPVGLNILVAGYAYAEGKIAFDPTVPIVNAHYDTNTEIIDYSRVLDVWGNSAKFEVALPYSSFSGSAVFNGQPRQREVSGFNDPQFRFSINFVGAPALTPQEFAGYQQDLVVGASLLVTVPLGQYDDSKLINLGNNRWQFKAELGVSKGWGPWTLEIDPGVWFFTNNTDFNKGHTLEQAPLYSVQGHILYNFLSGEWVALDGVFFTGNETTLDRVRDHNMQTNTRFGVTLGLPLNRNNSLKLYASGGASTRDGSFFNVAGFTWQYRWGGGF